MGWDSTIMKYRTIVADPPWHYESWPSAMSSGSQFHGHGTGADWNHDNRRKPIGYPTLSVAEIAALPVLSIADSDGCHIYLWTTNRYLADAFGVLGAWGFR